MNITFVGLRCIRFRFSNARNLHLQLALRHALCIAETSIVFRTFVSQISYKTNALVLIKQLIVNLKIVEQLRTKEGKCKQLSRKLLFELEVLPVGLEERLLRLRVPLVGFGELLLDRAAPSFELGVFYWT
uniref:Uncharacterized protein n=1 Tax=Glossina pallidipes TaxID=7398 RepID=A0A1A9Z8F1_GLOPL